MLRIMCPPEGLKVASLLAGGESAVNWQIARQQARATVGCQLLVSRGESGGLVERPLEGPIAGRQWVHSVGSLVTACWARHASQRNVQREAKNSKVRHPQLFSSNRAVAMDTNRCDTSTT